MTETETIDLLISLLASETPFVHVRFGDGDVFFMTGTGPKLTADGEHWTEELQAALNHAWYQVVEHPLVLLGDLETYAVSDGCENEWRTLLDQADAHRDRLPNPGDRHLVHMEALRVGFGHALPFYLAVKVDPRPKVMVSPMRLAPVAARLGCEHIPIPLHFAHEVALDAAQAVKHGHWQLALFAAGRGGKIAQGALARQHPTLTTVDVGSGLDLLIADGVRRGTDLRVDRDRIIGTYRMADIAPPTQGARHER